MRSTAIEMHHTALALLLLVAAATAHAMPTLTVGDVTYENVTLKNEYPKSFFIKHDGGTAFVDKVKLTKEQTEELLQATSQPDGAAANTPTESTAEEKQADAATDPDVVDSAEGLFIQPTPETLEDENERKFFEACGKPDAQLVLAMLKENPDLAKVALKGQTWRRIEPEKVNGEWVDTTSRYKKVTSTHSALQWLVDNSAKTPDRIEAIKALVEAGADLDATTSDEGTNCARNIITLSDKLLPEELDFLLTKGANPNFGWCVGKTAPVRHLTQSFLAEKDPQKKTEMGELLRIFSKRKAELSAEGKQVIDDAKDPELAAIFAGN